MSKALVRTVAWKRGEGGNNMFLREGKLLLSYNPVAGKLSSNDPMGSFAQILGGAINGEAEPQEETAFHDGTTWRILLGDFRKEYEQAWPNYKRCLAVYEKNKEYRSSWSTDEN